MIDPENKSRRGAETVELSGNDPILLDAAPSVIRVESGALALYCGEVQNGRVTGPRRFICRVGSGQAACAAPGGGVQGLGLFLVPAGPAHVVVTDVDAHLSNGGLPSATAEDIEEWVRILTRVVLPSEEPRAPLRASGTQRIELDDDQSLGPHRKGVLWTRVEGGPAEFLSSGEMPLGEEVVPIGSGAWLHARSALVVRTEPTTEITDLDDLAGGLARLHGFVLTVLAEKGQREKERELERLRQRDLIQEKRAHEAMKGLASVLDPQEAGIPGSTPLLQAMAAVGRSLDVEIKPPPPSEGGSLSDPVDAIARVSRIRVRRVALEGEWWRRDCGPLLAFVRGEPRRPVALLQTRSLRYEIFDPVDDTRTPLDRRRAGELEPLAVAFYKPLPEGPLEPVDFFKFSLAGRKRELLVVGLTGILATLLGMITPQATALLMDHAIPDANRRMLLEVGLGLGAAALGQTLFYLSQAVVLVRIGVASESESQAALWDRLLRLRPSFFRQYSSGDLQARVSAVSEVGRRLSGTALTTLFASVMALLNLLLLAYYSLELSLIALAVGLVALAFSACMGFFVRTNLKKLVELEGRLHGTVIQLIDGVGKLRVAGAAGRAYVYWTKRFIDQVRLRYDTTRLKDRVTVFNQVLPSLSMALLFYVSFDMLRESRTVTGASSLTLGTFLAFSVAFGTFLAGVTSLAETVVGFLDVFSKGRRIRPILQEPPEIDLTKTDPGRLRGAVSAQSVEFGYGQDGPQVLSGVSIRAEPGELVALVGPSGSGKSTVLRLLLGFEAPDAGFVAYDGQDLTNLDVLAVRRQLGVVLQGGRLDAGTIYENIACGNVISLDDAWTAAEDAGFGEDVRQMPMGMHTIVSAGGSNLSGGQRQRLLIARSLAHRPRILLFDEATSALDNRTQAIVAESLNRLHVTRIVVAHRLSTIRTADRIYVLERGRIAQTGTFSELMKEDEGLFARMMRRQLA